MHSAQFRFEEAEGPWLTSQGWAAFRLYLPICIRTYGYLGIVSFLKVSVLPCVNFQMTREGVGTDTCPEIFNGWLQVKAECRDHEGNCSLVRDCFDMIGGEIA